MSIYEQDAVSLFIAIQLHLKQRIAEFDGKSEKDKSEVGGPVIKSNSRLLNIYAPVEGGGYEEKSERGMLDDLGAIDEDMLAK